VMGASFRNVGEILELAGCDLLTIAPKLLSELASYGGELERKLDPRTAATMQIDKINLDEQSFREMHEKDRMAREKLAEGTMTLGPAKKPGVAMMTETRMKMPMACSHANKRARSRRVRAPARTATSVPAVEFWVIQSTRWDA